MTNENTTITAIDLTAIDFSEQTATAIKAHKVALDAFLKDNKEEIAELTKTEKAANDIVLEDAARAQFKALGYKVGDVITATVKGESIDLPIVKITDKTVSFDNGGDKPMWRYYRWLVLPSVTVEVTDEVEEVVEG